MARGDMEMTCLEFVRKNAVKEAFLNGYTLSHCENWYGLHYEPNVENDIELIANAVMNCSPNPDLNSFPDFIFEDGFIEHFQVSASDRRRKGNIALAMANDVKRESEKLLAAHNETMLDKNPDKSHAMSYKITNYKLPPRSYDMFLQSFKRHWEDHINSFKTRNNLGRNGIFMIQCYDFGFSMAEDISADFPKSNVRVGSFMKEAERFRCPRLSRCPELLEYMYEYCGDIKYVIYVCSETVEFFRTDELIYIKGLIRHPYLKIDCPGIVLQPTVCITTRQQGKELSKYDESEVTKL